MQETDEMQTETNPFEKKLTPEREKFLEDLAVGSRLALQKAHAAWIRMMIHEGKLKYVNLRKDQLELLDKFPENHPQEISTELWKLLQKQLLKVEQTQTAEPASDEPTPEGKPTPEEKPTPEDQPKVYTQAEKTAMFWKRVNPHNQPLDKKALAALEAMRRMKKKYPDLDLPDV